ncbi:lysophosphatidylcholine acyltransferase 1-like isoform X2 [Portunus trituberculatus]|uniref:lysophosphatidylcholine acyltransferase 1-like isoform X2 n=1 Tax=Portunus trituberculatus TaxID=210409 RepID=UPI001E1CD83E|nr:lysophosphatidylcholine acyltransferase 1-like isoform X2 [Portunus trituberculatus]
MCKMSEKEGEERAPLIEETAHLLNPFVHRLELNTAYDKFKLVFMSVVVLPVRVVGIVVCLLVAYVLASTGLWGLSREDLSARPLSGWRRVMKELVRGWVRGVFTAGGFHLVQVKGQQAHPKEAPILAVAPHSSYFDALPIVVMGAPSVVAKGEVTSVPFFAKYIDYTQPVYVWREDPNSRQNTIQEIKERASSEEEWPQIMVFPEGTCTNRSCLITFKPGAFYPGVPVQPVLIRYNNRTDSFTWTWDGPGALKMLWVTLCQFHNYCELEYLPVYTPNEEEKQDAKLFANNVRQVMADALGVPVADYTYDDCRLMHKAKLKNLPCETGLIEFLNLRQRFGLNLKNVEEELLNHYADIASSDGQINFSGFAKYLGMPESEPALIDLFKLYDKDNTGTIDFRKYLMGYYQYCKPANTEETLKWGFKLLDQEGKGQVFLEDAIEALQTSLDMTPEEVTCIFKQADQNDKGYITYEDFEAYAKRKPEYAKIFLLFQESLKQGTRPRTGHLPPPGKKKAD